MFYVHLSVVYIFIFTSMSQHPEILKQLKEGSYKAFNSLYEQYFDLLYGFIFGLTRSHEQTKELVQEAFIKVWINRQKIDLDLSFKAWLFKMAQNQLKDQLKKQFNNPVFEDYLIHCSDEQLSVNEQDSLILKRSINLWLKQKKSCPQGRFRYLNWQRNKDCLPQKLPTNYKYPNSLFIITFIRH